MKRGILLILSATVAVSLSAPAEAYTFLDRSYGTPQLGLSARARGMGGAGVALGNGPWSLVDNPGAMSLSKGTRVDVLGGLSRDSENRFVPLFDTFDSFVDENAVAVNDHTFGFLNGGAVVDPWDSVILGFGYFERYDPRYKYKDERRSTLTSDEVINNLILETEGVLRSLTFGASYPIQGGHGVGLAVNYYHADYSSRQALVPQASGSAQGSQELARRLTGFSVTLGGVATLSERITVGAALETAPQLDNDYTLFTNGEDVSPEVQFGAAYRPRNDFRTTFALDLVYMPWTELKDSSPANPDDSAYMPPDRLQDTWEARFGLEHVFYNDLPARIGFRYGQSYAMDEADRATFTFGFGYIVNAIRVDLGGEIGKRNSRQEPVRPRAEQGPAVGLSKDRIEDTTLTVTLGASYSF